MATRKLKVVFLCLLQSLFVFSLEDDGINEKIYDRFLISTACFRRLNGTHQIGCQSEINGNVGIVHNVVSEDDVDWILKEAPHPPYVALLASELFLRPILLKFKNSGKVNGVLVIHTENRAQSPLPKNGFSSDYNCPNSDYGFYRDHPKYNNCSELNWNPTGTGMMFDDWPFPIGLMTNETEIKIIITDCYERFNKPYNNKTRDWPLCAAELRHRQSAAKDSITCLRRSKLTMNLNPTVICDPFSDDNSWGFIKSLNKSLPLPPRSIIMASARLDAFSMFDYVTPAADSTITGLVILLAAAEVLGKVKHDFDDSPKNLMFALFNGEAFDYIGSSKMVYDMHLGEFPQKLDNSNPNQMPLINTSNIEYFVEVSQMALHNMSSKIWLHSDPVSQNLAEVKQKVDYLKEIVINSSAAVELTALPTPDTLPLPPASFQMFLKGDSQIPGIVLANHEKEYVNKFYNSRWDLAETISLAYLANTSESDLDKHIPPVVEALTAAASALATSLYSLMKNDGRKSLQANSSTVVDLLYCYLVKLNCSLFRTVSSPSSVLDNKPVQFYIGVTNLAGSGNDQLIILTRSVLAYFLGDRTPMSTQKECDESNKDSNDEIYTYLFMQGPEVNDTLRQGYCVKSTVHSSQAISPAFVMTDSYDPSTYQYSTWAESRWASDFQLRIFLKPSKMRETVVLSIGVIILLVFLVLVYFVSKRANKLFTSTQQIEY